MKRNGQVLIILVTSLFLGGGLGSASRAGYLATGMTMNEIKPRIEKNVLDPVRRKALAKLLDEWTKIADDYLDRIGDRRKEFLDLIKDHGASPGGFDKQMEEIDAQNDAADKRVIDIRFSMRELMSRAEWEAVFGGS